MVNPIRTIDVRPNIPEALKPLRDLADNLWFVWTYETEELFRRINQDLWLETRRNPVEYLCRLKQEELEAMAGDEAFLAHQERVWQEFERYMSKRPDPDVFGETKEPFTVAYFTAECGVADCLPIYSGGLGILSGDHLKSASDLNLPLVGISLAYQKGYFRQYLTQDGWQMETYPVNHFSTMPMKPVRDDAGNIVKVAVELKGEQVMVRAWRVDIGRTCLYLLDTNLPENSEWGRSITSELYGGDREMRIRQEIILGIGGLRMLKAVGIQPAVCHMNEGHSAFACFERIRQLREDYGLSFNEALEFVRMTNVFTTHTPVPAGIDTFAPELMQAYFDGFARTIGISLDVLLGYGRQNPRDRREEFSMAVLALRLSNWNNGVSRLHGKVSRSMFRHVWSRIPEVDLPITHVTNGVHIPSWISRGMSENCDRYLGPRWIEDPDNTKVWERVNQIPDTEVWRTHVRGRERLVAFARQRLRKQLENRGQSNRDLEMALEVLNSEVLTIGFARRFAPYKRAHLILRDIPRLERILTHPERPVQIVFAGKAHPQDEAGKQLIKDLIKITGREKLRRHMVFLEDYDMEVGRRMVQGVDVWLNTPRRPNEACGTSGMKAAANGALQVSILDGWWDEGYDRELGWAIGSGETYDDPEFQDDLESRTLYDILEKDVAPLFYDRGADGLPRRWIAMMKRSLHRLSPVFNTHRMVEEYWERFYCPAAERGFQVSGDDWEGLRHLTRWRDRIMFNWSEVKILGIRMDELEGIEVGKPYLVEADVHLGELAPEDVVVEVYGGRVDPSNQFLDRFVSAMTVEGPRSENVHRYRKEILFEDAGHFGLNIRIIPNHPNPESRHAMGLVVWGEPEEEGR
ncbi:MAG: alpha-glucan family phosphorylase [Thermodesulfobacteriota bacterium]